MDVKTEHLKSIPVAAASLPRAGAELEKYLTDVIVEARELIETVVSPPKSPWSHQFNKTTKYGNIDVSSRNHEIEQGTEYWFARKSIHKLAGGSDGFVWDDFTNYLLRDHSENEREYGPSVSRVDKIDLEWNTEGISLLGWDIIGVSPYAIHHHLPWPLSPRVFPILLILVSAVERKEMMVISLPIQIEADTKGINTATNESVAVISPKSTIGQYVSVEQVAFQEAVNEAGVASAVWSMATASDASGNIPMALQRRVIGTSVSKDPEAFLDYVQKKKAAEAPK